MLSNNVYNLRDGNRHVVHTISQASGYNAFGKVTQPTPSTPQAPTYKPMVIPALMTAYQTAPPTPTYTAPAFSGRSDSAGSLPGIGYGWNSFQRDCGVLGWGAGK